MKRALNGGQGTFSGYEGLHDKPNSQLFPVAFEIRAEWFLS